MAVPQHGHRFTSSASPPSSFEPLAYYVGFFSACHVFAHRFPLAITPAEPTEQQHYPFVRRLYRIYHDMPEFCQRTGSIETFVYVCIDL
jgi:hypothetical protein